MKIAYVTTFDSRTLGSQGLNEWSGTGYYIAQSLKSQSIPLEYVGPLKDKFALKAVRKYKRHYYEFFGKNYIKDTEPLILKDLANQVAKKLVDSQSDLVFSASIAPVAYLECDRPIVFWADATFENTHNFYPQYSNLCDESIANGHAMEALALKKCALAIYSSEWAGQTAIDYYQADPRKVKVVPFGANIQTDQPLDRVQKFIKFRPHDRCKLLFLGVDWLRKGGDVALKVTKALNESGLPTELTVVGCQPASDEPIPDFVTSLGFISKSTQVGKDRLTQLIAESHFLILPSIADCTPIIFCEANSLGVPCLSTNVGGIPSIIESGVNGQLFDLDTPIEEYCNYITNLFSNYPAYQQLAISAFDRYKSSLNWGSAGQTINDLLTDVISPSNLKC
jgi:glycosyltransferase involved in cell wall biosynthesis